VIRASQRPGARPWALGALLAIAVLLVLVGALLVWQPTGLVRALLWVAGHDEITVEEIRVGLNRIDLTEVTIGRAADQRIRRLRVDYRISELLRGRIEQMTVEGVTLRGRIDQDGLRLQGLDAAGAGDDGASELPALPLPDRLSARDIRVELATPLGLLIVPLEADLHPEQDRAVFALHAEGAELAAPAGVLRADLRIEGEMPLDPQAIAGATTASGRLQLRADGFSVPGAASGLDGAGQLAFVLERGQLDATLSGTRFRLEQIAPEWDTVAALLPAPWQAELAGPAGISASLGNREILLKGSGDLALTTAGPHLRAALTATVELDSDRRVREIVVPDAEIDLRDFRWADLRLDRASVRTEGAGSLEEWQGTLDLDLAGAGAPWPGLLLENGTARAGLDVRFGAGRLDLIAREQGALLVEALRWAEDVRLDGLEVRVQPSSTPLLTAAIGNGAIAWQHRLDANLPAFDVRLTAGAAPLRLEAETLQVELAGAADGLGDGRVVLSGGAVQSRAHRLRVSGIGAEAQLSGGRLEPGRPVPIAVATIVHEAEPPWFAPLSLQGSVQPEGDRIAFDVKLAHTAGAAEMSVRGRHDLASGVGRAQVELPPVDLAPGRLQPGQLSPRLGGMAQDVSGRLALDGSVGWGTGDLRADLALLVESLAFSSGPARFEQVNGVIALDRLAPPSTPPGQQVAIGLVNIGLPLTNGLLTFDLEPEQLLVEQLRWQFAEGRIRAAPFTIGSEGMRFSTTLSAERLQLNEIFALAQLDGLTGEGTMHGTVPITVAGSEATVRGGELVSDRPGWVRYRPQEAPAALQAGGQNVNLLLQALENFRYEKLRLTIDGRTDGEMDVGLHLAGANPELYGGHPIEFNLNLEGALADVVRAGLAGYQIPERIRERMQGFGR
jgi:Dicarboxylate transport